MEPSTASTRRGCDDVEQKFVAIMHREQMAKAEIVINHSGGPCKDARLGCDAVLDYLLGEKSLLIHWPDPVEGWVEKAYGAKKEMWQ
ncbi:DddA-like double-stranded DNA deaminase toxin [Kitasatospora sp. NPDC001574]